MPAYRSDGSTTPQSTPILLSKFDSPEALDAFCQSYFDSTDDPSIYAFSRHLGMTRQTLWEYLAGQKNGITEAWRRPLKMARDRLAEAWERRLHSKTPVGAIFALKAIERDFWNDTLTVETPGIERAAETIRAAMGDLLAAARSLPGQTPLQIEAETHDAPALESPDSANDE